MASVGIGLEHTLSGSSVTIQTRADAEAMRAQIAALQGRLAEAKRHLATAEAILAGWDEALGNPPDLREVERQINNGLPTLAAEVRRAAELAAAVNPARPQP